CGLLLALIPVASMTLTSHQRLYLVPFFALFVVGAALGASVVVRAMPAWAQRPRAWIGLLALLVLPSSLPALKDGADQARVLARRIAAEREALARELPVAPAGARGARAGKLARAWNRGAASSPRLLFSDT